MSEALMLGWLVGWSGVCASGHTCLNIYVFFCMIVCLHERAHVSELILYMNGTTKLKGRVCNREIDSLMNGNRKKITLSLEIRFLVWSDQTAVCLKVPGVPSKGQNVTERWMDLGKDGWMGTCDHFWSIVDNHTEQATGLAGATPVFMIFKGKMTHTHIYPQKHSLTPKISFEDVLVQMWIHSDLHKCRLLVISLLNKRGLYQHTCSNESGATTPSLSSDIEKGHVYW